MGQGAGTSQQGVDPVTQPLNSTVEVVTTGIATFVRDRGGGGGKGVSCNNVCD